MFNKNVVLKKFDTHYFNVLTTTFEGNSTNLYKLKTEYNEDFNGFITLKLKMSIYKSNKTFENISTTINLYIKNRKILYKITTTGKMTNNTMYIGYTLDGFLCLLFSPQYTTVESLFAVNLFTSNTSQLQPLKWSLTLAQEGGKPFAIKDLISKAKVHVNPSKMTSDADIANAKGVKSYNGVKLIDYDLDPSKKVMDFADGDKGVVSFDSVKNATVILIWKYGLHGRFDRSQLFTNDNGYPFANNGGNIINETYHNIVQPAYLNGEEVTLYNVRRGNKWNNLIAQVGDDSGHEDIQRFGYQDRNNGRYFVGQVAELFVFTSANAKYVDDNKENIYKILNADWNSHSNVDNSIGLFDNVSILHEAPVTKV